MAVSTLLLLRHGPAENPRPDQADAERTLTADGRRLVEALGAGLAEHGQVPDRALVSPYLRAVETLDALSRGFGKGIPRETAVELVPDGGLMEAEILFRARMAELPLGTRLLGVSHLPLAEQLVARLSGHRTGLPPAHGVALAWDGHRFHLRGRILPSAPFLVRP